MCEKCFWEFFPTPEPGGFSDAENASVGDSKASDGINAEEKSDLGTLDVLLAEEPVADLALGTLYTFRINQDREHSSRQRA